MSKTDILFLAMFFAIVFVNLFVILRRVKKIEERLGIDSGSGDEPRSIWKAN
jgi:hypothetical protein